ncbi:partial Anthranilate synthase component 1, partial [uncultured bacterium]
MVDRLSLVFGPRRYFRVSVRGFERVPPAPVMMVSNHSGGTTVLDAWGFGWAWYRHFGTSRPIHPAAHEIEFVSGFTQDGFENAVRRIKEYILAGDCMQV